MTKLLAFLLRFCEYLIHSDRLTFRFSVLGGVGLGSEKKIGRRVRLVSRLGSLN
jgi:hypothetical protein